MQIHQTPSRPWGAPTAALLLAAAALCGCSLDKTLSSCANCGEIRSITPRVVSQDIRLITTAPAETVTIGDTLPDNVVFDVRVRMDRGGSRDFVLTGAERLRVGTRVEVRGGRIVPWSAANLWS
jgi:hypothetical protein